MQTSSGEDLDSQQGQKLCRIAYVVSQELAKISSLLPSNRNRSILVHTLINKLGLLTPGTNAEGKPRRVLKVVPPRSATVAELCLYHDRDYVDFVLADRTSTSPSANLNSDLSYSDFGIEDDCPPFDGLNKYVQMVAGATLTAVDALKSDAFDIAICWDGGRHHAQKSRASGYCYVADCVLAILALRKPPLGSPFPSRKPRIMYLDLDLHFSDAVSESFYKSCTPGAIPQVLTLSIHHSSIGFFPPSPLASLPDPKSPAFDPFTLSIPLCQGASSATFKRIWHIVEDIKKIFDPNFIIVQCGADGLAGDPCGVWNWRNGLEEGDMGWCINKLTQNWAGKLLLLGGGGYNSPNTARAWAHLTSVIKGCPLSLEYPIPDHASFPAYAPSFILEVPEGNMRDENTPEYVSELEETYVTIIEALQTRLTSQSPRTNMHC